MRKNLILVALLSSSITYAHRDLETGTFLTRDPIGYGDGPNVYCYVHGNPITKFDPLGLCPWTGGIYTGPVNVNNLESIQMGQQIDNAIGRGIVGGVASIGEGYAGIANHTDRASGKRGVYEQQWAQIETTLLNEAINQLASDKNARSVAYSAFENKMNQMSATDQAEALGYITGRILTGAGVSYLGSRANVPWLGGPTVMAAGGGNAMELMNDFSNKLREALSSGEFGGISFENNMIDQLTNEQIQEILSSPDGQQLMAEIWESLATGNAEFDLSIVVNQDDEANVDFSFGDYEYSNHDNSDDDSE